MGIRWVQIVFVRYGSEKIMGYNPFANAVPKTIKSLIVSLDLPM